MKTSGRIAWAMSLSFALGCMEINKPDRMIYPVRQHFLMDDAFSKANGVEVGLDRLEVDKLTLTYIEPERINDFQDTVENKIDLWIIRTPSLDKRENVLKNADLHFQIFVFDSMASDGTARTSEIRIYSRNIGNVWVPLFKGPLSWVSFPNFKKGLRFNIPDTLFQSCPYFAWVVVRTIEGGETMFPPLPSLGILDEKRFREMIY